MGNMVEFDMRTDLEGLNNNLKLSYALVNFRTSSKKWSQITGMCFLSMDSTSLSGYFHSIFTQVTIYPSNENTQIRPTWVWGILKRVRRLDENGMVEYYEWLWVSLVFIATKPQQENVPWHEYQWRVYVSCRKLNQVTQPFIFHISWCNDAVQEIDTEDRYFIVVDMESGYWQVVTEE